MPSGGKSGGQEQAARALRALERGATTVRAQVARSVNDWRRRQATGSEPLPASEPVAVPAPRPIAATYPRPEAIVADVSDIEVSDLRAELARELERLAGADISASRGAGKLAGEAPAADGQAPEP